jgi:hypothetical protein
MPGSFSVLFVFFFCVFVVLWRSELCMVYGDEDGDGRRRKAVGPVERELDQPLWSGRSTRELSMARGSKRDRWKVRRRKTNGERAIERDL